MEAALERYTEVFDFAPIGYATLDRHGVILEINHAGARLLDGERGQLAGKRFQSFVLQGAVRVFDQILAGALDGSQTASGELDLRRAGGAVPVRITAAALRRVEPTLLVAFEDISMRRGKELELERTEASSRELNQRKDEFLAMLSHELRNPLSPIRTSVAVLQMTAPGSEAATSAIGIIDRAATHLTRLVDDLLDVTRITRGQIQLRREPVDLVALVARTVEDHRAAFVAQRLELELEHEAEPHPLWAYGDAARIVQAMSNVLRNAAKFTPAGGRVRVTLDYQDPWATITLADNGVGIAPELLDTIFEPFAQAPQSLDRGAGGLGLGLALVKSLVELHDGRVAIQSGGIGKGTEVQIALPARRERLEQQRAVERPVVERRRILIIEDMADTAQSLLRALELKGHEARVAYSGLAGLAMIESYEPDLVLCDLGLPDIDGFALAERVRADIRLRSTCLVALGGYARPEDVSRAVEAGFDRHLAKPAPLDELDDLIARVPQRFPAVSQS